MPPPSRPLSRLADVIGRARGRAPGSPRAARLVAPDAGATVLVLAPGRPALLGRAADCDLRLDDASVSRHHARLEPVGADWQLVDEGSANGCFVNSERVERRRLADGDSIALGSAPALEFRLGLPAPATTAQPASPRGVFARLPAILQSLLLWRFRPLAGGAVRTVARRHFLVGRAPEADLHLASAQASGLHARIERAGGGLLLRDLDSANGTRVDGERVRQARLRPGTRVDFADEEYLVTGSALPSPRGWLVLGVLAASLLLGFSARLLVDVKQGGQRLWTRDMYVEQAERSIDGAVRALDRRPPSRELAGAQFDIAIRSLVAADRLNDPEDEAALARALRQAAAGLGRSLGGRDVVPLYRSLHRPEVEPALEPAPFDLVDELVQILAQFGIDTEEQPIPPDLLAEVRHFVDFWTGPKRDFTRRSLARARPHLAMIRRELRASQLPEVFCYLPFIESGYRNVAVSTAGAGGMWQFMPAKAREYDLRVDDSVDERTNPDKLTVAACRYLNDLLSMFGANAFMCALASYNKGEYGMLNCLRGVSWRSSWKFWDIVAKGDGCLRQETVEYVPKFLAGAIVLRRPEAFGLEDDSAAGEGAP